jgi:polyisoprenoid-binding protein YceI
MTKVCDPRKLLLVALLAVCTTTVQAAWQLVSDKSQLSYTTTKVFTGAEKSAAENNRFAKLEGKVGDNGMAEVRVLLDSVNTNVAIRDERMRKIVFQTEKFPAATVSAQVPANVLSEQGLHQIDLTLQLELHGMQKSMTVPVSVVNESNRILVTSMSPVLIEAADFGLDGGILELTKLAGLMFIPTTVPVSFSLVFQQ